MKEWLFSFLILIASYNANAQYTDTQLWTGITLEQELIDDLTFSITEQVRFNQNISNLKYTFTELDLEYKTSKPHRISVAYRNIWRSTHYTHRFDINNTFRYKVNGDLRIYFRNKLQFNRSYLENNEMVLRNRIKITQDVGKKVKSYLAAEFFNLNNYQYDFLLSKARYTIGCSFELKNNNALNLAYSYQPESLINSVINASNILSLKYKFTL